MTARPMPEPAVGDVRIQTLRRWVGQWHRRQLAAHVGLIGLWSEPNPHPEHWRVVREQLAAVRAAAQSMAWIQEVLDLVEEMEREAVEAAGR